MEFTSEDIRRLYGSVLYLVPQATPTQETTGERHAEPVTLLPPVEPEAPQEPVVTPEPPSKAPAVWLSQGSHPIWKMKPEAKMAILLSEAEIANRDLTTRLRKAVERVGLDRSLVGFGEFQGVTDFQVTDCPVDRILICSELQAPVEVPHQVEGKSCWFAPPLTAAAASREAGLQLIEGLKAVMMDLAR